MKVYGIRYLNIWYKIFVNLINILVVISKSLKQKNK